MNIRREKMSDPVKIERGLSEAQRGSLARARYGRVDAGIGEGHTVNALHRRGLVPERNEENLVWCCEQSYWALKLTPLGLEVAKLARMSSRPGGGKK